VVDSAPLADQWPDDGPTVAWRRPLGDGHSSILVGDGRLYTMYRPAPVGGGQWASEEIVVSLDAASGDAIWEHRYPARPLAFRFGAGPYATPLIVGDRLFTLGTNNQLHALNKATGAMVWSHDLVKEFGAQETLIRPAVKAGMSGSPLAFGDLVIVPAGGRGQAVMAFRQETGEVAWKGGDFNVSQAALDLEERLGPVRLRHQRARVLDLRPGLGVGLLAEVVLPGEAVHGHHRLPCRSLRRQRTRHGQVEKAPEGHVAGHVRSNARRVRAHDIIPRPHGAVRWLDTTARRQHPRNFPTLFRTAH
jgi:hypothetical protein